MEWKRFWNKYRKKIKYGAAIFFGAAAVLFIMAWILSRQAAAIFNLVAERQHFLEGHITVETLSATPLGHVLKGCGNNGNDGTEGVRYRNVFGCYSHGPVLPKNPAFSDELIRDAFQRKTGTRPELEPLDDTVELLAHDTVLERVLNGTAGKEE